MARFFENSSEKPFKRFSERFFERISDKLFDKVSDAAGCRRADKAASRQTCAADSLPADAYTLEISPGRTAPAGNAGRLVLRPVGCRCGRRSRYGRVRLLAVALVLLLAGVGVFGVISGSSAAAEELPFRLHIIANSDSAADQAVKLQVRDAVVDHLTPLLADVHTREQARGIVEGELADLEMLAAGICACYAYGAAAEIGSFDVPPKRYGAVVLPAGEYQALRIVLGEGSGHNWWCVLFPPLCFVDECGQAVQTADSDGSLRQGGRVVRLKMAEIFSQAG